MRDRQDNGGVGGPGPLERLWERVSGPFAPRGPAMDQSALQGFERVAVPLCRAINANPRVKRAFQDTFLSWSAPGTRIASENLWDVHGFEHVAHLAPPRSTILVSNHRSFFDMYVCSSMFEARAKFYDRLYFPVRSNYFYDSPAGFMVNMIMSGTAMWPPVFRDSRKGDLNPVGVAQILALLEEPGALVGMHPEGTRGKGPDPYEFLPARPGIGRLLKRCHPETLVLPYFIRGLSSDILHEVKRNFRPPGDRGEPMRIWLGEPRPAPSLVDAGDSDLDVAERVLGLIADLAAAERADREAGGAPDR